MSIKLPSAIKMGLNKFQAKYSGQNRATAFLMMSFGHTSQHKKITDAVKAALQKNGVVVLRADDEQFCDELLSNVLTCIHGCKFGIAVFERIESDGFNPNVSLEVGYMKALGKPICFLKERTLKALPTDLMSAIYMEFDVQSIQKTIPSQISKWMTDTGLGVGGGLTGGRRRPTQISRMNETELREEVDRLRSKLRVQSQRAYENSPTSNLNERVAEYYRERLKEECIKRGILDRATQLNLTDLVELINGLKSIV